MTGEFYETIKVYKMTDLSRYKAICLFAAGYDRLEIEKRLGISQRQLQKYFADVDFNYALNQALSITFKSALAQAVSFTGDAITILQGIASSEDTPSKYRIQAVQTIFEVIFRSGVHETQLQSESQHNLDEKINLISTYSKLQDVVAISDLSDDEASGEKARKIWNEFFPQATIPKELSD